MRKTLMQTGPYITRIKEGKKCLDENRGQLTCIMNELLARRRDVYKQLNNDDDDDDENDRKKMKNMSTTPSTIMLYRILFTVRSQI